jgi:hypothetical protein
VSIQRWNEIQELIETLEGQLAEIEYGRPIWSTHPFDETFG